MGDVIPFGNEAFEPEIIAAMSDAYEKACVAIPEGNPGKLVRELVAKRIIALAQQGYRDREKMYADAMISFGA
jgi:hypothetical protein